MWRRQTWKGVAGGVHGAVDYSVVYEHFVLFANSRLCLGDAGGLYTVALLHVVAVACCTA